MKRVLTTGHKGFIGSRLVAALQQCEGVEIIWMDRMKGGDLLDFDSMASLSDVDIIVHLAGSVGVMKSWNNPHKTYANNIVPTLNILEFARVRKASVIFMSSYVYGKPSYLPIDEAHPTDCSNPYAKSKRQAEMLCEAYSQDFGVPVVILRPFNIYGPGQKRESLIPHILQQAMNTNRIEVMDLRPKRDYLYIDDLTNALLKVICSERKLLDSEIYNLGFGQSYSVQNVIDITVKLMDKKISVHSVEELRPNEILDCYSNSKKFSEQFNWKPQTNLMKGIAKLLETEGVIEKR
ncbi:MAG: SDR family oxidoreductase [Desulfobacula sp.]|jgi:nucleoside-diphosphate-sugar epimerase|nr:SDR family oxidoreductase [Desulfobacula sp.]